jgi:hypothetical protein
MTGLKLRWRVRWRRQALTKALAEGADPDASEELTQVARELVGMRMRQRLAAGVDRILRAATEPAVPWSATVPLNRREVVHAYDELSELADRLRAAEPVPVHAVARVVLLLTEATSPLYHRFATQPAWDLARTARLALDDPIA